MNEEERDWYGYQHFMHQRIEEEKKEKEKLQQENNKLKKEIKKIERRILKWKKDQKIV